MKKSSTRQFFFYASILLFVQVALCFAIRQTYLADTRGQLVEILKRESKIQDDQIRELTYELVNVTRDLEHAQTKGHVEGILSFMARPEYYSEVWHSGYDRGYDTKIDSYEVQVKEFVNDKQAD